MIWLLPVAAAVVLLLVVVVSDYWMSRDVRILRRRLKDTPIR